ncbi:Probable sugar phosphate/phosphate translocator [Striga hermonthica]|nr:Probable sugar phosphate/phosphate translocator [Striga hermonthica]
MYQSCALSFSCRSSGPFSFLIFTLALFSALNFSYSLPSKPHLGSNLVLLGDAKFEDNGSCIRLADPGISSPSSGFIIQRKPIKLFTSSSKSRNPVSFSTDFTFSISPHNGDGLAFLLVPTNFVSRFSAGSFGILKERRFLVVEYDTSVDEKVRDPNSNHVGVDVGSLVSSKTSNVSSVNLVLNGGVKLRSWIDYDSSSKRIESLDLCEFRFEFKISTLKKMSAMKSSGRLFTIGLVTAWYSSNIGVLLLNKYLLSNYGFKYPIFLTMCHMTACSLLSYVAIAWMKMVPMQTIRSRVQFMKISALSLIFCASVVSGNISLKYLPVSFNQAIGATTPFFTAVFAYLMTLKREAWLTYLTLVPVVTGVIIASGGEPSFHLFGFIMCVGATAARALKSVVQGILLSSEGEKLNSMNLLLYMAPIAVVLLLPATIYMEENVVGITLALARDDSRIIWLLLFNSALAYFVNLTNFLVTKHTSALTLQVLGNAKGAVAVVISILIFRNPVSVTGMLGYTLTVFGVILYSEAKKRSK